MRTLRRAILAAVLAVLVGPVADAVAQAQTANPRYSEVRVRISRLLGDQAREEIATVRSGDTITIEEGTRIRMGVHAVPVDGNQKLYYPRARISESERGGSVLLQRVIEDGGAAIAEVVAPKNQNRDLTEVIHYEVLEPLNLPAHQRRGSFTIRVEPGLGSGPIVQPGHSARQVTNALYRGILMRDLDDEGARGTIDAIQRNGFNGVLAAGRTIANSDESRIRIHDRGVTNEQRLLSLYRHLLGLESSQVDRGEWDDNLRRIADGDIADVVDWMLRSDRFRSRWNF